MSILPGILVRIVTVGAILLVAAPGEPRQGSTASAPAALPKPLIGQGMSLTEALYQRRSVREFLARPLEPEQVSQLCWAAQGITDPALGRRAAPSAGALYPLELYVVTARGVQRYLPAEHVLTTHIEGDIRRALSDAALSQESIAEAPLTFVIAAVVQRSAAKYGGRAERYCFIEAGHVGQNILLQATALGLAGVPVGAFEDERAAKVLKLPSDQRVLYLIPVGFPRR